ncbi:uncharacterized protein LOC128683480 [Plodia interpunctella]|uniref:uncharacterized protein LOC128683480 n=1 Tax=Plodia interpunctella TaxID=58824 RepID=UPI0023685C5D|nr:uncharacterized protein LOC128683480 [Plodia interpunctella]
MSSSSSESFKSDATSVPRVTLPALSRELYNRAYDTFISWKNEQRINNFDEYVFLTYFQNLAKTKQPSTLYNIYSMLKATVNINNDINIENYKKLTMYLRQTSKGFQSKKTKVFTIDDVDNFLREAPDKIYLCLKVVLILGVNGACRASELMNITVEHIERPSDALLLVKLVASKTNMNRSFVLRGVDKEILEKYLALRPANTPMKRLLLRYHNGRCVRQVIGKNTIAVMPAQIAEYLHLPDPKLYTGHCFRRTAFMMPSDLRRSFNLMRCEGGPRPERAELREVYIDTPTEPEASNENVDILNIDSIKEEFTIDLELFIASVIRVRHMESRGKT